MARIKYYDPETGTWKYADKQFSDPTSSGGNVEKNLILTLLKNAAYTSGNMGAVLEQLETLWSGGEVDPDIPDEPDVPDVPDGDTTVIPVDVISGSVATPTGEYLRYNPRSTDRAVINPVAFYVEKGKKYTVKLSDYKTYKFYVSGVSTTVEGVDFTVVEGTVKDFAGDYQRVYTSGGQSNDLAITPDGTYQAIYIVFGTLDNAVLTADDIAAIREKLTITVE